MGAGLTGYALGQEGCALWTGAGHKGCPWKDTASTPLRPKKGVALNRFMADLKGKHDRKLTRECMTRIGTEKIGS